MSAPDPRDVLRKAISSDGAQSRYLRYSIDWDVFHAEAEAERAALADVDDLVEAAREYHALMPALADCANECGEATLYSDAHQANQKAEAALARFAGDRNPTA